MFENHDRDSVAFVVNEAVIRKEIQKDNPSLDEGTLLDLMRAMIAGVEEYAVTHRVTVEVQPFRRASKKAHESAQRNRTTPSRGEGLGDLVSAKKGEKLLREAAIVAPPEKWAGELKTPSELAKILGVSRTTIDNWRKDDDVIAFPKGKNSHIYPVRQFISGRPLVGLKEVCNAANREPRVIWRWLITPHLDFSGKSPLDVLEDGGVDIVVEAVKRDFN